MNYIFGNNKMLRKYNSTLLRLFRRSGRFIIGTRRTVSSNNNENGTENNQLIKLIEQYRSKILFNSHMDSDRVSTSEFKYQLKLFYQKAEDEKRKYFQKLQEPYPVSLKYVMYSEKLLEETKIKEQTNIKEENVSYEGTSQVFSLPYRVVQASNKEERDWMRNYEHYDDSKLDELDSRQHKNTCNKIAGTNISDQKENELPRSRRSRPRPSLTRKMTSDGQITESDNYEGMEEEHEWRIRYGTPDPMEPISNVPCGGCGALLHCSDTAIPGYIPSEIFINRNIQQLKTIECQRCHFLKEYNVALNMNVLPEEYPRLLSTIQDKNGLVLVMVDLMDFPGSLWPGVFDIIGQEKTVIIVGNKVDLLPQDSQGFLKHVEECIIKEIKKLNVNTSNIKCVTLISAKTGYGIEELITSMYFFWNTKGDTYLVGCTNVGKSSLFNALLQSDYCKVQAVDIVRRATVSNWPGTTLNMLKFPIQKPTDWQQYERTRRLQSEKQNHRAEVKFRQMQLKNTNNPKYASLIGNIGRTFHDQSKYMPLGLPPQYNMTTGFKWDNPGKTLDEKGYIYRQSRWCYDTPGLIQPEQIIKFLTTEELLFTIPMHVLVPRTFYLSVGQTLFLGGLIRLDFLESEKPVRLTIFASELVPVTVCHTVDASELYEKFIGTEVFTVPKGGKERMKEWPGLTKLENDITVDGVAWMQSTVDFAISSIGWIAVTPVTKAQCKFAIWSPEARGVTVRSPPLLPYAVNIKGKRVKNTPAYRMGRLYSNHTH